MIAQRPVESSEPILWIHGDCLSPHNPAFERFPNAPAVFVFDDALLAEWEISLKRLVFMYECLLELPVSIRRGEVAAVVVAFAAEHEARRIVTVESPSPRFRKLCRAISAAMPSGSRLEVLKNPPFVDYDGRFDLKRFSRYWGVARKYAFD
jgi:hypothetical protein